MVPAAPAAAVATANPPMYAVRRPDSSEGMAPRSPASSNPARIPDSTPGLGSSTSVRRWRNAFNSLRYCTSSAWHRRHESTWRRTRRSARSFPSITAGNRAATESQVIWSDRISCLFLVLDGVVAPHREQPLPQLFPRSVQPHLGGRLADPQLLSDGLVGEVVDVAQHHDRPQSGRKGRDGFAHPVPLERRLGPDLRIVVGPLVDQLAVGVELVVAGLAAASERCGRAV